MDYSITKREQHRSQLAASRRTKLPAAHTLPRLNVVILAAGFSTRLGRPKRMAKVHGRTLLARILATVAPFGGGQRSVAVITPPRAARQTHAAPPGTATFIANPARASGLSSSVRLGLRHARYCAGVLLIPVDLIDISGRDIARLVRRWRGARRRVVAAGVEGLAAPPMIVPHWLFEQARGLTGDQGLRTVVRGLPAEWLIMLTMPSAAADIDTPSDLSRARRTLRPWRSAPSGSRPLSPSGCI